MADRLAKLEKAYRRYPDSPLFARLADLYLDRGKTEEALEVCRRGCQHFPDYATGFLVLSKCYEVQGEVEQARDALDQSLRIDPVNPGGYRRLSGIYQKLGESTLALKTLEQAALLDPLAEDLGEQVDQLTYQVRLESTRQATEGEVDPVVETQIDPVEQMLVEESTAQEEGEEAEPFAMVQALPEWDDEPDMGKVLEEFKQEPNPLFAEGQEADEPVEKQVVEKGDPPEIGDIAALLELDDAGDEEDGDIASPAELEEAEEDVDGDGGTADAVASLGMEVMAAGPDAVDTSAETDSIEELDFSSPFDPALVEGDQEEEEEVELPSADEWVRYAPDGDEADDEEEISIFSPDVLPEDSDIFQPVEAVVDENVVSVEEAVAEIEEQTLEEVDEGTAGFGEVEGIAAEIEEVVADAGDEDSTEIEEAVEVEESFNQDAFNDILSALRAGETERPSASVESAEVTETTDDQTGATNAEEALQDEPIDFAIESEEPVAEVEIEEPVAEVEVEEPEDDSQRPAIDLGPLIEAMVGMGKTSPEVEAKSAQGEVESPVEGSGVAGDEPEAPDLSDLQPPAQAGGLAEVEAFDLSGLEPPAQESGLAEDEPEGAVEAEVFDLSDLEPPAQAGGLAEVEAFDLSDLEPPAQESSLAEDEPEGAVEAEVFDLSDLQPPAQDAIEDSTESAADITDVDIELPPFADQTVGVEGGEGAPGDIASETGEEPAEQDEELSGRGAGFNMRGDDELLRIFQEIETEGHADGEVEEKVEKTPEVEQQKRIATVTLAEIYTIQGLTQKAIETYRELLSEEPDNAFIRRKLEDLEKSSSRK